MQEEDVGSVAEMQSTAEHRWCRWCQTCWAGGLAGGVPGEPDPTGMMIVAGQALLCFGDTRRSIAMYSIATTLWWQMIRTICY